MREALQRAWLRRSGLALPLWPVSLLYGALAAAHRAPYRFGWRRPGAAGIPVIVVGNVVAGGAGKTPVVIALVQQLQAWGVRVGVVSRGHGRASGDCLEVTPQTDPEACGDEPLLVARRCGVPVVVAARRLEAVRALRRLHPQVQLVVSDDGLQHHALARDVEICVFDDRGAGNGWLLPAGPLREPWPRAVDVILKAEAAPVEGGFVLRRRLADVAVAADGSTRALQAFGGADCDAVAGIAQPERVCYMLRARGLRLRRAIALPDHHRFTPGSVQAGGGVPLLCTEKDAAKLWRHEPRAWAVPLEVDIEPAFWAALRQRVMPRLSSCDGSQAA